MRSLGARASPTPRHSSTRDRIEAKSDESRANTVTVRVARTVPVADAIRDVHAAPMQVRIERWQDKTQTILCRSRSRAGASRTCGSSAAGSSSMLVRGQVIWDLPFPSKMITRQNQWPTYSEFTGVSEDDFSFETTITAIERSTITVAAKAPGTSDGYYDGGMIRVGGIGEHGEPMYVRTSVGVAFEINGRVLSGLSVGDAVTLIAGDDKSLITARDIFGQQAVDRFLGFDLLPTSDVLQTGLDNAPIVRAPYTSDGQPPTSAPGDPTPSLPPTLVINQAVVQTPDDVTLTLTVDDPGAALTSIEVRTNSVGFAPDWSAWTTLTPGSDPTVYAFTAAKGRIDAVRVQVRITYVDPADSLTHQQTTDDTYHGGWHDEQTWAENTPSAGLVTFDFDSIPGQAEVRGYLTMTQDDTLAPSGPETFAIGDSVKLAIDARGGPFTLSFPPKSYLDSAPVTSLTVNGLVFLQMTITFAPYFDWVTR
jgi:hypothetical protein